MVKRESYAERKADAEVEMAAFDSLPKELRDGLAHCAKGFTVGSVLKAFLNLQSQGFAPTAAVSLIKANLPSDGFKNT